MTQLEVQISYECACALSASVKPYILRRVKSDVIAQIELKGKNEQVLFCKITETQRGMYEQFLQSKVSRLS